MNSIYSDTANTRFPNGGWPDILPKDTLPKDILPKDILPNGHFADGRFAERTFCRTDILPNGHFAERTVCRTDNLPKIEISSELFKVQFFMNSRSAVRGY